MSNWSISEVSNKFKLFVNLHVCNPDPRLSLLCLPCTEREPGNKAEQQEACWFYEREREHARGVVSTSPAHEVPLHLELTLHTVFEQGPWPRACNYPTFLSRRFHRLIYFKFEFTSNSDFCQPRSQGLSSPPPLVVSSNDQRRQEAGKKDPGNEVGPPQKPQWPITSMDWAGLFSPKNIPVYKNAVT